MGDPSRCAVRSSTFRAATAMARATPGVGARAARPQTRRARRQRAGPRKNATTSDPSGRRRRRDGRAPARRQGAPRRTTAAVSRRTAFLSRRLAAGTGVDVLVHRRVGVDGRDTVTTILLVRFRRRSRCGRGARQQLAAGVQRTLLDGSSAAPMSDAASASEQPSTATSTNAMRFFGSSWSSSGSSRADQAPCRDLVFHRRGRAGDQLLDIERAYAIGRPPPHAIALALARRWSTRR